MNYKNKSGTLFIIAAPSGAGKTSLVKALVAQTDNMSVAISHTTRLARSDEKEGESYYFVDETKFRELIKQNCFLEYAQVFNNYYGTSRNQVEQELANGKNIILEIDWQGAQQVVSQWHNCVSIFILPPDLETLRKRLVNRQNDTPEAIEFRMEAVFREISHHKEFDYIIINNDFERALSDIRAIVMATCLERCRQSVYYDDLVAQIVRQAD